MPARSQPHKHFGLPAGLWIAFVVVASLGLSQTFACATPFAALAALGASTLRGRDASALVLLAWLGNQAVGFGLLHYPWDSSTIAWGLLIGIASLAALAAAQGIVALAWPNGFIARLIFALLAAFAAYELVLYAATWFLPSGADAFAPGVVLRIFAINAVALALLIAARQAASVTGLLPPAPAPQAN